MYKNDSELTFQRLKQGEIKQELIQKTFSPKLIYLKHHYLYLW